MAEGDKTPLQQAVRQAIERSGKSRDALDRAIQERTGSTGKVLYDIERGKSRKPSLDTLRAIAEVTARPIGEFTGDAAAMTALPAPPVASEDITMVGIRHTDAAFGLGAQFLDVEPEVEVLHFPKIWVESITYTSPTMLSWARARGASMGPTIGDGDMVLIDHSQRTIEDQDLIWAYTIYDTRGIKRLKRKGDRVQILSDNPSIPIDEEPLDYLNIIGRVVAVIQKQ